MDFSYTFRLLTLFETTKDSNFEKLLDLLLSSFKPGPTKIDTNPRQDWTMWFTTYENRLKTTENQFSQDASTLRERLRSANPRFVLRQWVLEEAIERLERKNDKDFLARVLRLATNPFESYGEPILCDQNSITTDESKEDARLCDVGPSGYLGFQCSCSS